MSHAAEIKLAVAYIRKSTEDESRQVESFQGQEREISRFAGAEGYTLVKWYKEAYTGTEVKRRKVFLQMLEDARSKALNFKYVICYDISRFGRLDNDEAGYYRHEFRKAGVDIIYAVENLQGDDTDDLIVSTKQWLAREYSRKIGEYVCRNIVSRTGDAHAKARAFNIGRAAPFGYDTVYLDHTGKPHTIVRLMADRSKEVYDTDGKLLRTLPAGTKFRKAGTDLMGLVPSLPERVDAIRRIFRWYVDENLGLFAIVNRLNEDLKNGTGIASATGKPWCMGSVQQILQNEHYAGNTVFNKRSMGKFFKLVSDENGIQLKRLPKHLDTTIRKNPRADWIVIKGTHEPIIPPELFYAAQSKRKKRNMDKSRLGRSMGSKYLFSGKLVCASCGFHFQGQTKRKRKNGKTWERIGYVCGGYKLHGKSTCHNLFLPADIIEETVFEALEKEVRSLDLSGVIGRAGEELTHAPKIADQRRGEIKAELARVEARLETLLECITPENKEIISEKMVALQEERDRLNAELL